MYRLRLVKDFPANEVKPLRIIEQAARKNRYRCYGLKDGEELLAYAFFMILGEQALLDYFAVRQELRGTGIGSRFLRELGGNIMKECECVLLETEDPAAVSDPAEKRTRERRLRFYLKNGLRDTGVRTRVFGSDYRVMAFPGDDSPGQDETVRRYKAHYRAILSLPSRAIHVKIIKPTAGNAVPEEGEKPWNR